MTVAALFVLENGPYANLPGVDVWGPSRDARTYAGPWPVVAHPPCSRWCQLAHINQKRYGHQVGDDGGCFASALESVRTFGGVLEHPAFTYAWPAFGLPKPTVSGWQRDAFGGWVAQVSQGAYGHRARKLTWLYYVGQAPPSLRWNVPEPTAQVSFCKNHGDSPLPRLSKREASATPPSFRDLLLDMARTAQRKAA
jgi:hypothetical protein